MRRRAVSKYRRVNLFDKTRDIVVGYVVSSTGEIVAVSESFYQDYYIPILSNTTYTLSLQADTIKRLAWYDENKSFISRSLNNSVDTTPLTATSPSGAKFVRVSCSVSSLDTLQLELGSTTTPYEPYLEPWEI